MTILTPAGQPDIDASCSMTLLFTQLLSEMGCVLSNSLDYQYEAGTSVKRGHFILCCAESGFGPKS